jgi:hypothetical protein
MSRAEPIRIGALDGLTYLSSPESLAVVRNVWERLSETERKYVGGSPP